MQSFLPFSPLCTDASVILGLATAQHMNTLLRAFCMCLLSDIHKVLLQLKFVLERPLICPLKNEWHSKKHVKRVRDVLMKAFCLVWKATGRKKLGMEWFPFKTVTAVLFQNDLRDYTEDWRAFSATWNAMHNVTVIYLWIWGGSSIEAQGVASLFLRGEREIKM